MSKTLKEMTLGEKLEALGFADEEPMITKLVYGGDGLVIYEIESDPGGKAVYNDELKEFLKEKNVAFEIDDTKRYYIKYLGDVVDADALFNTSLSSYCEGIEYVNKYKM